MVYRDIKAEIYLYRTEDGGRKSPMPKTFRSPIRLVSDKYNDVCYELIDVDELKPGENGRVYMTFHRPDLVKDYVKAGA